MASSPTITAHWPEALSAARCGDLEPAEKSHALNPEGALGHYFYGRCLAEAEERMDEALEHLRAAIKADPGNRIFEQTLALALVRTRRPEARIEAGRIWKKHGLPYDRDLLTAFALTIESDLRPFGECPDWLADLTWPSCLTRVDSGDKRPTELILEEERPESVKLSLKPASKPTGLFERLGFWWRIRRLEKLLIAHQTEPVLRQATAILETGRQTAELHLLAGIAAEECGALDRARAHLARCVHLEPDLLIARAYMGRVYWRLGWNDLAESLWRSLPVEGPYDNGRHYYLALAHEAWGNRCEALNAMAVALGDFFYDTLHFYVQRSFWLWQRRFVPDKPGLPGPSPEAKITG